MKDVYEQKPLTESVFLMIIIYSSIANTIDLSVIWTPN